MLTELKYAFHLLLKTPRFSFTAAFSFSLGIGLVALWLPARRTARVDPLTARRVE